MPRISGKSFGGDAQMVDYVILMSLSNCSNVCMDDNPKADRLEDSLRMSDGTLVLAAHEVEQGRFKPGYGAHNRHFVFGVAHGEPRKPDPQFLHTREGGFKTASVRASEAFG